jgi:hypothetical protein
MAMTAPDYQLIAEVLLFSEGFSQASWLAGKVVHLYKLAGQQLSQQVGALGGKQKQYWLSAHTLWLSGPSLRPVCHQITRCAHCGARRSLCCCFFDHAHALWECNPHQVRLSCSVLQGHYDFGMRALKAVLTMAGGLKRSCKGEAEDVVVIQALRDANLPKLLKDVSGHMVNLVT